MFLGTTQLLDRRALTKPPSFSGNDEDWDEWNFQFVGYVGLVSQAMHTPLRGVSRIAQPFHGIDALEDTLATQKQYQINMGMRHGDQYEPTTSIRTAGMMSPEFRSDSLESWESFSNGKRKCSVMRKSPESHLRQRLA
eukprot:271238-Amphidinium_carterae.2